MNFPAMAIDNFYDDPDYVRNFALSQDFYPADNGEYPGKRSKPLDLINRNLFDQFLNRFFSIYYDFEVHRVDWQVDTYFQIIEEYDDEGLNSGWTHLDNKSVVSGVIYLNKESIEDSGTVICELKENEIFDDEQKLKHDFYLGKLDDLKFYKTEMSNNNQKFHETIIFKNKYNRLISFDGTSYHRAQNYKSKNGPRLTQVFFVNGIRTSTLPIERLKIYGK